MQRLPGGGQPRSVSYDLRSRNRLPQRRKLAPVRRPDDGLDRYALPRVPPRAGAACAAVHRDGARQCGDPRRSQQAAGDGSESSIRWRCSWAAANRTLLAQAARIGAEYGFDEINLNCGCPSDRVQAGRFGACLMREPALVADSVAAMIAACGHAHVPVTVKCRLGVDDDHDCGSLPRFHRHRRRRRLPHVRGPRAQCLAAGPVAEGKPRGAAAALRLGVPAQARAAGLAGHRQRRHRQAKRSDRRIWRMPTARCSAARRTTIPICCIGSMSPGSAAAAAHARRVAARDAAVRRSAARARRRAQAHHPPPARPVCRRARRPCIPPGTERRRAQAGRRLVAGRARAGARPNRFPTGQSTPHDHPRHRTPSSTFARALRARFRPGHRARRVPGRARRLRPRRAIRRRQPLHGRRRARSMRRAPRRSTASCTRAFAAVLPTVCFAGDPADAGRAVSQQRVRHRPPARYIVGRMRHAVRQREADARRHPRFLRAACSTTPRSTCRPSRIPAN